MRTLAYLNKTARETLREWKVLGLALSFAPAFVYIMYASFGGSASPFRLVVVNHDVGPGVEDAAGPLVRAWRDARQTDGSPVFAVAEATDLAETRARVRERDAELLVEIPRGFSASIAARRADPLAPAAQLVNHADERNLRGSIAMAMSDFHAFSHVSSSTGARLPLDVTVSSVGGSHPVSDFEIYVPAIITLAIIMVLFTAATSLVKEVDKGTMTRLMLSRLHTWELLSAVSVIQVLTGVIALTLAYLAARSCGFQSAGSLAVLLVVGAVGALGVVAIAVLVSAFLKSMFELLTVGVFPFFVLMFFSDCMFPLPKVAVLTLGSHVLYANDVLPTAVCVRAFNKVLGFGAGLGDVAFELGVMLTTTAVYFVVGAWLFSRRHQRV